MKPHRDLTYSRVEGFNPNPAHVEILRQLIRESKQNEADTMAQSNNQHTPSLLSRLLVLVVILAIAGLFAVFVWPTRYRYDHYSVSGLGSFPIRIDRITGEAEMLRGGGWLKLGGASATPSPSP